MVALHSKRKCSLLLVLMAPRATGKRERGVLSCVNVSLIDSEKEERVFDVAEGGGNGDL